MGKSTQHEHPAPNITPCDRSRAWSRLSPQSSMDGLIRLMHPRRSRHGSASCIDAWWLVQFIVSLVIEEPATFLILPYYGKVDKPGLPGNIVVRTCVHMCPGRRLSCSSVSDQSQTQSGVPVFCLQAVQASTRVVCMMHGLHAHPRGSTLFALLCVDQGACWERCLLVAALGAAVPCCAYPLGVTAGRL